MTDEFTFEVGFKEIVEIEVNKNHSAFFLRIIAAFFFLECHERNRAYEFLHMPCTQVNSIEEAA